MRHGFFFWFKDAPLSAVLFFVHPSVLITRQREKFSQSLRTTDKKWPITPRWQLLILPADFYRVANSAHASMTVRFWADSKEHVYKQPRSRSCISRLETKAGRMRRCQGTKHFTELAFHREAIPNILLPLMLAG